MTVDTQDDIRADFLMEAGEIVQKLGSQVVELEQRPADRDLLNAIFRGFHTVKGGAGFLALTPLVELCHHAEEILNALRHGRIEADPGRIDTILQSVNLLEQMMAAVERGESPPAAPPALLTALHAALTATAAPAPVTVKAEASVIETIAGGQGAISEDEFESLLDALHGKGQSPVVAEAPAAPAVSLPAPAKPEVAAAAASVPADPAPRVAESSVRVDTNRLDRIMNLVGELVLVRNRLKLLRGRSADPDLERSVGQLDRVTSGLQASAMQLRMQPVGKVFARFPKLTRDVARSLGKKVELTLEGESTDLDKNLVEALADPLVHLVRNAIDHGIEMPDLRVQRGKPPEGRLLLSARQEGDRIVILVRDDGAGMDAEVLRRKSVEKGLLSPEAAARLSKNECLELIFAPGFSTKVEVSDLSGRGVGMDVVKSKIAEQNGVVTLESEPGVGTTVRIAVPLTLAILPALMFRCERIYALALSAVQDVFLLDPAKVVRMDNCPVLPRAGGTLPLIFLDNWLGLPETRSRPAQALVITVQSADRCWGVVVDEVLGREEVVVKPLGALLQGVPGYSGATITGEGAVALILDIAGVLKSRP